VNLTLCRFINVTEQLFELLIKFIRHGSTHVGGNCGCTVCKQLQIKPIDWIFVKILPAMYLLKSLLNLGGIQIWIRR